VSCDASSSGCCNGIELLSTGAVATHFPDLLDTYRQVRHSCTHFPGLLDTSCTDMSETPAPTSLTYWILMNRQVRNTTTYLFDLLYDY